FSYFHSYTRPGEILERIEDGWPVRLFVVEPLCPAYAARSIDCMLWSDPENNPPKDMRDMQAKMRRAGLVLALAMVVAMFVLGMH
ncbi:hypothetical protein, partial [Streptomyces sp. NPDC046925]|uniref:morphogenic membrane protein MmpB n=1 Tax=Streptomyces sp. NPDC046925 TaxID=3155375 RepID=UPI0033C548B1